MDLAVTREELVSPNEVPVNCPAATELRETELSNELMAVSVKVLRLNLEVVLQKDQNW